MIKSLNYALSSDTILPHDWAWSTIGKIADVVAGNPAPQGDEYFSDGSHPFLRVQDMGRLGNNSHVFKTHDYINDKAIQSLRLFPKGSVLFTKSGASTLLNQRAILGRDMYVVSHIAATIPHEDILSEWLYYWLKTVDFNKLAHATTLPSLPLSKAKDIPIPVAPYDKQKLIVSEIEKQFSRLDEAVAGLKRIKANLKRYKAAVLKAAVEGKLTEEWRKNNKDVEPAEKLFKRILIERKRKWEAKNPGKKYKEPISPDTSNLPELPKGWVWANLENVCCQIGDVDHKMPKAKDKGIPYISTKDFLPGGDINYENAKKIDQADYDKLCRKIFPVNGDILLSRYGTVGEVRLVKTKTLFQASYSIAILKPVSKNMNDYLSLVLQTEPIQKQIKKYIRATAQPDLGLAHIRLLSVPIASTEEQNKIIQEIDRLFSVTDEIEAVIETNLKRAERLRQSILKKAFEGRLLQIDNN